LLHTLLPSVVAIELEQVAADAIRTAFDPTTPGFRGLIDRFLADRERLLKGPYVSVSLPFTPYLHQENAFLRLSSASPLNTLVATGTGSGKTEGFLLPLLDHCRLEHAQGSRGIKALLIYPMNALAADQARRIAQLIHSTFALAGLRAGLYIGASDDEPTAARRSPTRAPCTRPRPTSCSPTTSSSMSCSSSPRCRASEPTTDAWPMAAAPCASWWWMGSTVSMAPRAPIWQARSSRAISSLAR
jgi:hypothetical protein